MRLRILLTKNINCKIFFNLSRCDAVPMTNSEEETPNPVIPIYSELKKTFENAYLWFNLVHTISQVLSNVNLELKNVN